MKMFKVSVIIFLLGLSTVKCDISKPKIEVFTPRGFSISMDDDPGITSVEFDVKIQNESYQMEFIKNVKRKRNGRWTFTKRNAPVEIENIINYRVFVVKNHKGYIIQGGPLIVKDLVAFQKPSKPNRNQSNPTPCKTEAPSILLQSCEETMFNATQALMSLEMKMQAITKMNDELIQALERYPDAKKLTLSGRIPPDDEPEQIVTFILREKLDLEPKIISAMRNKNQDILFEVSTIPEKLEILDMAKQKLMYSKMYIS